MHTTIIHEPGITFIPYQNKISYIIEKCSTLPSLKKDITNKHFVKNGRKIEDLSFVEKETKCQINLSKKDNKLSNLLSHLAGMKRSMNYNGTEYFSFASDNKLKILPPNSYKFKPKDHIIIDEVQECLLDNLWFHHNNKRDDKGYMLSILNSLAEYLHMINKIQAEPIDETPEYIELKPIYVVFEGKLPGIYISFEKIVAQKIDSKLSGGISWKKYTNIDEAYMEPAAKEYIQKFKTTKNKKISGSSPLINIKEEEISRGITHKERINPLDESYIETKVNEKIEKISPQWRNNIKEEILKELRKEINDKLEDMRRIINEIPFANIDITNIDTMDIAGHGQFPE